MARSALVFVAAVLGWSACRSAPPFAVARILDGPSATRDSDVATWRARELLERDQHAAALEVVRAVLEAHPDHMDAQRVRQDVLRARGRLGVLLHEAEHRIDRAPAGTKQAALAHYLRGRIVTDPDAKRRHFETATRTAPESFWGWLGLAFVARKTEPVQATALYGMLYKATQGHPIAAVALAAALREQGEAEAAERVYGELREHPLARGLGDLGVARTALSQGRSKLAWSALLRALQLRPWDAGVRDLLSIYINVGVTRDQVHQVLDVLADPDRRRLFQAGDDGIALARFWQRAGEPHVGLATLSDQPAGARAARVHRLARDLRLRGGDVAGYLRELRAGVPSAVVMDERNHLRGTWQRLFSGPWYEAADPLASQEDTETMLRALVDVGQLDAIATLGALARARHGATPKIVAVQEEVAKYLAFERSMRRLIYRGQAAASGQAMTNPSAPADDAESAAPEAVTLDRLLKELRRVSTDIFGRDVVGEPRTFRIPLVGTLIDPFGPGLPEFVARYNRHLVLGQFDGRPPDALMLGRLAVRTLQPDGPLPLAGKCFEVIGQERVLKTAGMPGVTDFAGVALLNHFVIDMAAVRDWAADVRRRRRIARDDGDAVLRDPVPRSGDAMEPADVAWRLGLLSPVADADLDLAVLEMIRWHERAHLVDSFYFLPVGSNLWRVLGLLFGNGFSRSQLEGELEARAETAALAFSAYPRLVLAHIATFLEGDPETSPHARGFRALAARVMAELRRLGVSDEASQPRRWHELDPARATEAGKILARQLW